MFHGLLYGKDRYEGELCDKTNFLERIRGIDHGVSLV